MIPGRFCNTLNVQLYGTIILDIKVGGGRIFGMVEWAGRLKKYITSFLVLIFQINKKGQLNLLKLQYPKHWANITTKILDMCNATTFPCIWPI